jgi:hypothetical protein
LIIIPIKELKIRNGQIKSIRNVEREMHVNGKILNTEGDLVYNSRIKIINKVNSPLEFLYRDFYSTPGESITLSSPKVVSSSSSELGINERYKTSYEKTIKIDAKNEKHKFIECEYNLEPPLNGINDFIEYDLELTAKKHAKSAFEESGLVEGFIVKNVGKSISMTISAPANYTIKLIDYWIEDQQGLRQEELKSKLDGSPVLSENDSQICWKIKYPIMNHLYLFKFKLSAR